MIAEDLVNAVMKVAEAPLNGGVALLVGIFAASEKAKEKYGVEDLDDEAVPEALREFLQWVIDTASEHIDISLTAFGIE